MKLKRTTIIGCAVGFLAMARGFSSIAHADPAMEGGPTGEKAATFSETKSRQSPGPSPSPKPSPTEEEEEILANHRFLGDPVRAAGAGRTTLFIGREVPVPTEYNAPRVYTAPGGTLVVQPSTPRAFENRKTGVTLDSRGRFEQTELEGFIDYGSPIRTVVPVYNDKGELVGTALQEHPNAIIQPVFRTIRK